MKTKPIAVAKSEQRRIAIQSEPTGKKGERPPKNPRVPIFPPQTARLVNKLHEILDSDPDQDRRFHAYALLTRVCVMWTFPYPGDWPRAKVDYIAETGLLHFDNELLRDTVTHMQALFPNGEGLPEEEWRGPL